MLSLYVPRYSFKTYCLPILSAALLLMATALSAQPTLSIESVTTTEGGTVQVSIDVDNVTDFEAFGFDLLFDDSLVGFQSIAKGTATDDWGLILANTLEAGKLRIGGARFAGTAIDADGAPANLAVLEFQALPETAGNTSPLTTERLLDGVAGASVTDGQIEIVACSYEVSPASFQFPEAGGSQTLTVSPNNEACGWTAVSNASWVTITLGASGTGTGDVEFTVGANAGPERSTTIIAAGQSVIIDQSDGCTYSITPISRQVGSNGGNGSFTLTAGTDCPWTVEVADDWVDITSSTSGTGSSTVSYAWGANTGDSRQTTITVGGRTFTLRQDAAPPEITPGRDLVEVQTDAATNAGNEQLTIRNTGAGTLDYTIEVDPPSPWLSLSTSSGSVEAGPDGDTITLSFTSEDLSPGLYTAYLTISDDGEEADDAIVAVQLFVKGLAPKIDATPLAFSPTAIEGQNPSDGTLTISNAGFGSLAFQVSEQTPVDWLSLIDFEGTVDAGPSIEHEVTLDYLTDALAVGQYSTTLQVEYASAQDLITKQAEKQTATVLTERTTAGPLYPGTTFNVRVRVDGTLPEPPTAFALRVEYPSDAVAFDQVVSADLGSVFSGPEGGLPPTLNRDFVGVNFFNEEQEPTLMTLRFRVLPFAPATPFTIRVLPDPDTNLNLAGSANVPLPHGYDYSNTRGLTVADTDLAHIETEVTLGDPSESGSQIAIRAFVGTNEAGMTPVKAASRIVYDGSILQLDSVTAGDLGTPSAATPQTLTGNYVSQNITTAGNPGNGEDEPTLFTMNFTVLNPDRPFTIVVGDNPTAGLIPLESSVGTLVPHRYNMSGTTNIGGPDVEIPVNLTIEEKLPEIAVSPATVEVTIREGLSPDDATFTVRNSGGRTLDYGISDNASWLSVSPTSGSSTGESDTITIAFDTDELAPGQHTGRITVAEDNKATPKTVTVNLTVEENEAPTVAITTPAGDETVSNETVSFDFAGTSADTDGTVETVEYRIDGGAWAAAANDAGDWSAWSFSIALEEGTNFVEVRATDDFGDASSLASRTITRQGVNTPPIVSITVPALDQAVDNDTTSFEFSGSASDPDPDGAVASVQYRVDGGSWNSATNDSSDWTVWSFTVSNLVEGDTLVEVRATDDRGDSSSLASRTITREPPNELPEVLIVSPQEDQAVDFPVTSYAFSGDSSDSDGEVTEVRYRRNEGEWMQATQVDDSWTSWTFTAGDLVVGANVIDVQAIDEDGAESPIASRTITREANEAPSVTITTPATDQTVPFTTTTFDFAGTASDPDANLSSVEYRNNGGAWQSATTSDGFANWNFTVSNLAVGSNLVEVRSIDGEDAESLIASRTITREANEAPSVLITEPATDETVPFTTTTFDFAGTASDAEANLTAVEYRNNGGSWRAASTSDGFATWNFTVSDLAVGSNLVEVRSTDGEDAESPIASRTITRQANQSPTVVIIVPNVDESIPFETTSFGFEGTANDPEGELSTVEFRQNGGSWQDASSSDGFESWTFTAISLVVGDNLIEVRAVDNEGAESAVASRTITREEDDLDLTKINEYTFRFDGEGWNFNPAPGFVAPYGQSAPGYLTMAAAGDNLNTVGLFDTARGVPVDDFDPMNDPSQTGPLEEREGPLYLARYYVRRTTADPRLAPNFRLRASSSTYEDNFGLIVASENLSQRVPDIYRSEPVDLLFMPSPFMYSVVPAERWYYLAFDLINANGADAPYGGFVVDHIEVFVIPRENLEVVDQVASYDFESQTQFDDWEFLSYPGIFTEPSATNVNGRLSLSIPDPDMAYGTWQNVRNSIQFTVPTADEGPIVMRMTARIEAEQSNPLKVPESRIRVMPDDFTVVSETVLSDQRIGQMVPSAGEPRLMRAYIVLEPEDAGSFSIHAAWDILSFESYQSPQDEALYQTSTEPIHLESVDIDLLRFLNYPEPIDPQDPFVGLDK